MHSYMYSSMPNLVLGFHGCSSDVFEKVIVRGEKLKQSTNSYDWLGHNNFSCFPSVRVNALNTERDIFSARVVFWLMKP